MRYNKIFLFRPDHQIKFAVTLLPTGLGILAEQIERINADYDVFDMALSYKTPDLLDKIATFKPDLIGGSLICFLYRESYSIITEIKNNFPDVKIVVGGPHVSMFREKVLSECKAIDFATVKEGEESFVELIQGKPLDEIKGIYYRKADDIVFTGDRPPIKDLDPFSYPKYQKFELGKYSKIAPIYSSRGCPFRCTFCAIKDVIGSPFRALSNDILLDQVRYWYEKGYRKIAFSDDNFTFRPKRIFEFCELIKKNNLTGIDFAVWDTRADSTSRELLVAMKEVGFHTLLVGVESANNRILKILKKGETIEEIDRMVKDACELGFDVQLSFLIGSPYETIEEVENSFQFSLKYPIKGASFFNIVPTPNTEMLAFLESNNYLKGKPEDYLADTINSQNLPLIDTPEISLEERRRLLKKSEVIAHKIIKNYWLHRLNPKRFRFASKIMIDVFMNRFFYNSIINNDVLKRFLKTVLGFKQVGKVPS